jgi:uncharacterized protein (TIGR02453 family)
MKYFTEAYNQFFKELAANNNRDWYHANKSRYEKDVKKPFEVFVNDLIAAIAKEEPAMAHLQPKDAIFRIFRDTRFSNDKTPYKLYSSAVLSPLGRKDMEMPGTYIQLGVGEIWIGGGSYMPDKVQIEKIRTAMIQAPEVVESLVNDKKFIKYFGEIRGEKNKRLLKPFSEWTEKMPLIANKQFYFMAEFHDDEKLLLRDDLLEYVMGHYHAAKSWQEFLRAAIK